MAVLGNYVGTRLAGSNILVITDPANEYSRERLQRLGNVFLSGLSGRANVAKVVAPSPPESGANSDSDAEMLTYEYYLTAAAFDEMMSEHPECNMVLSMMGLPYDFAEMSFWEKEEEERQKLVLVNANLYDLRKAIMGNFIQAAVAHRQDIKYDMEEEVPEDYKAAFEKRYLMVTPETVDQIAGQFPKMFKPLDEDEKEDEDKDK